MRKLAIVVIATLLGVFSYAEYGHTHGVVGKRFFPTTLVVDDPFVSDELDLLKVFKGSTTQDGTQTSVGFEFSKRLTPDFELLVGWEYLFQQAINGPSASGSGNPDVGFKYVLFRSPEHETILATGFDAEIGGIGPESSRENQHLFPGIFIRQRIGRLARLAQILEALFHQRPIAGQYSVPPANRHNVNRRGWQHPTRGRSSSNHHPLWVCHHV